MDLNYYVVSRQMYLALKQKLVKHRCYETYNTKEIKNVHKKDAKADEEATAEEDEEALVFVGTLVNNMLHSVFSSIEAYINRQQIYNSYELYGQKSHNSNKFTGAMSEYEGVLHCQGYHYEAFCKRLYGRAIISTFFHKENENA